MLEILGDRKIALVRELTKLHEEVKCPRCGAWVDVFVKMGGAFGQTGTLVADETCQCGYILPAGSYETEYES